MKVLGTYGTMYYVSQMSESVAFFKENLLIEPTFHSEDWTEFKLGDHSLCLHLLNPNQVHPRTGILILRVSGLREMVDDMKAEGVKFHSEIKEVHPKAFAADFLDSDGNIISLYENLNAS